MTHIVDQPGQPPQEAEPEPERNLPLDVLYYICIAIGTLIVSTVGHAGLGGCLVVFGVPYIFARLVTGVRWRWPPKILPPAAPRKFRLVFVPGWLVLSALIIIGSATH